MVTAAATTTTTVTTIATAAAAASGYFIGLWQLRVAATHISTSVGLSSEKQFIQLLWWWSIWRYQYIGTETTVRQQ